MNSNRDMIKSISLRTGLPRAIVKDVMEAFEDYVRDEIVENGEVYVPKVFTAVSHEVKPRKVLDPRTMTWRDFPASYRLTFLQVDVEGQRQDPHGLQGGVQQLRRG